MGISKYSNKQINFAKQLIRHCEIARDSLPYHAKLIELHRDYLASGLPRLSRHEFWLLLSSAGKRGGAKQLKRKKLPTIPLVQEEKFELLRLCPEKVGGRDRLPYTTEFDDMYKRFKNHTGRKLTKNAFWRALAKTAKASRKPNPVEYNPTNILPPALIRDLCRVDIIWFL